MNEEVDLAFIMGICSGVVFAVLAYFAFVPQTADFEEQALERGYVIYCPDNGKLNWVEECENGKE